MKRKILSIIAVVLCFCMLMPNFVYAANETNDYATVAEYVEENSNADSQKSLAKFVNYLSNFFLNDVLGKVLAMFMPDSAAVGDYEDFDINTYGNFYKGMDTFIDSPQGEKVWSLGYGKASVLPDDFGSKRYAKGAYVPYIYGDGMYKDDDGNEEDLMARAIVMNDGSGRGNVVFISIDAMGLANADVRLIREGMKDLADKYNIVSINVTCTHIHTGIDSQGVWTDPVGVMFNNFSSKKVRYGVERSFINSLVRGSRKAVETALSDMTKGELYYSELELEGYLSDRTAPIALDKNLYKLEFLPFADGATPTIIATAGVHPEAASYDWAKTGGSTLVSFDKKFSADFIWYTEKLLNQAGYNFIFIQGNVSTVTSARAKTRDCFNDLSAHDEIIRYGYEIGYILLGMSMNEKERIVLNAQLGDKLGVEQYSSEKNYSIWYKGLKTASEEKVDPVLNIQLKQFTVRIENNVIGLLAKASIPDNLILKDNSGKYYTVTEVGYLEIGDSMKVYMSPGETFGELLIGGDGADGFALAPIREYTGEDIIIMDLMNDAAGYVANPANYVLAGYQYNKHTGALDSDTWCLISYGQNAATAFIGNFYEIYDSVN
ncbi:MAG: hypothetical protein IJ349_05955 [Clostridia bacterium]|nr:hypothetical protein [Clostridia bacterium]